MRETSNGQKRTPELFLFKSVLSAVLNIRWWRIKRSKLSSMQALAQIEIPRACQDVGRGYVLTLFLFRS